MSDPSASKPPPPAAPNHWTVGAALDATARTLGRSVNLLRVPRLRRGVPGAAPGIEHEQLKHLPSSDARIYVACTDYSRDQVRMVDVLDIDDFLAHHRPEWSNVRWINIDGLSNMAVVESFARKYELHPLAIEDMLHIPQRPKVDSFGGGEGEGRARLFIVVRMLEIKEGRLYSEQISVFLGHKTVLTFQETHGDVWDSIRRRIDTTGSRLRQNDASFLVYALLDAIVDQIFPILEHYGERLEDLEDRILDKPTTSLIQEVHQFRRELLLLRREVWPMRDVIHALQREAHECMSDTTRVYLRDIYDHLVQIIDIVETYRELATTITESYMTAQSNRLNEVMKVLTVIATIFIPVTFFTGLYGMNFDYLPGAGSPHGFWVFAAACAAAAVGMLGYFRYRDWL